MLCFITVNRRLDCASLHINASRYEAARIDEEVYRDAVTAVLGGRSLTEAAVILTGL